MIAHSVDKSLTSFYPCLFLNLSMCVRPFHPIFRTLWFTHRSVIDWKNLFHFDVNYEYSSVSDICSKHMGGSMWNKFIDSHYLHPCDKILQPLHFNVAEKSARERFKASILQLEMNRNVAKFINCDQNHSQTMVAKRQWGEHTGTGIKRLIMFKMCVCAAIFRECTWCTMCL